MDDNGNNRGQEYPGQSATRAILESISDGVFTVDHNWRITSFNRAAEEITGVPREEAIGRPCSEVFRAGMCQSACALKQTMDTGEPVVNRSGYIIDSDGERIPISVSTALLKDGDGNVAGGVETFRDLSIVEELRKQLEARYQAGDMVSRSPAMARVFELIPMIADTDATALIQGETGTGKELLARAIHGHGPRRDDPFVAVNCGAIPDTLLESELFGYKAGAFTGANRDKPGRFDLAGKGTIFLDEIGDISPALQVRLLRVLQERTYEPLGANEPRISQARVITAANRDLAAMVKSGEFREDLYYRVNVIRLELPPLRDRREDIPLLVDRFVERQNRVKGSAILGVAPEVISILMAHPFAGNIRELENVIEHAFVLCREDVIQPRHLPDYLVPPEASEQGPDGEACATRGDKRPAGTLSSIIRAVEARAIMDALERNGHNRLEAARELGMHKTTFFRKVRDLGLELPERDGRSAKKSE